MGLLQSSWAGLLPPTPPLVKLHHMPHHTMPHRFGKLLGMNSVILKEESRWVEHYYRWVRKLFFPVNWGFLPSVRSLQSSPAVCCTCAVGFHRESRSRVSIVDALALLPLNQYMESPASFPLLYPSHVN